MEELGWNKAGTIDYAFQQEEAQSEMASTNRGLGDVYVWTYVRTYFTDTLILPVPINASRHNRGRRGGRECENGTNGHEVAFAPVKHSDHDENIHRPSGRQDSAMTEVVGRCLRMLRCEAISNRNQDLPVMTICNAFLFSTSGATAVTQRATSSSLKLEQNGGRLAGGIGMPYSNRFRHQCMTRFHVRRDRLPTIVQVLFVPKDCQVIILSTMFKLPPFAVSIPCLAASDTQHDFRSSSNISFILHQT